MARRALALLIARGGHVDEQLHRLVARWIDAFNRREWQAYGECFTADVSYLLPHRDLPLLGRRAHVEHDRSHAGDGRLEVQNVFPCGDVVIVEGAFVSPERRSRWVSILELRDGRIAAERLYY